MPTLSFPQILDSFFIKRFVVCLFLFSFLSLSCCCCFLEGLVVIIVISEVELKWVISANRSTLQVWVGRTHTRAHNIHTHTNCDARRGVCYLRTRLAGWPSKFPSAAPGCYARDSRLHWYSPKELTPRVM